MDLSCNGCICGDGSSSSGPLLFVYTFASCTPVSARASRRCLHYRRMVPTLVVSSSATVSSDCVYRLLYVLGSARLEPYGGANTCASFALQSMSDVVATTFRPDWFALFRLVRDLLSEEVWILGPVEEFYSDDGLIWWLYGSHRWKEK